MFPVIRERAAHACQGSRADAEPLQCVQIVRCCRMQVRHLCCRGALRSRLRQHIVAPRHDLRDSHPAYVLHGEDAVHARMEHHAKAVLTSSSR